MTTDEDCSAAELIEHFDEGLRPDRDAAPTGVLDAGDVAQALLEIPDDELVGSTDAYDVRSALSRALRRVAVRQGQRDGLVGSGADGSIGGQRALGAVRNAIAATDLQAVVQNVRRAKDPDAAERILAASLVRLDRAAAAELSSSTPAVWDLYEPRSGFLIAVCRDPLVAPRYWRDQEQKLEADARATRDWALLTIGELAGASWKRARFATVDDLDQAEVECRKRAGGDRLFVVDEDG